MPLLLWLLPPVLIIALVRWALVSPLPSPAHRNACLAGGAAAALSVLALDIACLRHLFETLGPGGLLHDWRLPAIPAVASLFAWLGGWAATILVLGLRAGLRRRVADPARPSLFSQVLAVLCLLGLSLAFLQVIPLLAERPYPVPETVAP